MNNYKVEFDFSSFKKEVKPNILFPISVGQKYLQGDKFEAIIAVANEKCGTVRFIPVLQTHAKKMWLEVDDKTACQKASRDRNIWLGKTKEARAKLNVEDKKFKLPSNNYGDIKKLNEDQRCWEYWLAQSQEEISSVEDKYAKNSDFQVLINAAAKGYCEVVLIKNNLSFNDLAKDQKEFYIDHAKEAIFDELGVMIKWQTALAGQYDCMVYPVSETNIEREDGSIIKGTGALIVDCFQALFENKSDIKLPIIDIKIQSRFNNKFNKQFFGSERRNTLPKLPETKQLSDFNNNVTGLRRSKSFLHNVSYNSNCAPAKQHGDTLSLHSDSSSRSISTNSSTSTSPVNSLPNTPELKAFVAMSVTTSSEKPNSDSLNEPINPNYSDNTDDENADVAGMLDLELEESMPEIKENFLLRIIKEDLTSSAPDITSVLWENHVRLIYSQGVLFNDILELIRDVLINENLDNTHIQNLVKFTLSSEMIYKNNLCIRKLLQKDKLKGKQLERVGAFLSAYDNKKKAIQEHQSKYYLSNKEAANSVNSNLLSHGTPRYSDSAQTFFQQNNNDENVTIPNGTSSMANVLS